MARKRRTLKHRGYLYAQQHPGPSTSLFCGTVTQENVSTKRMRIAEAWRAGYLAAQNDGRRKK